VDVASVVEEAQVTAPIIAIASEDFSVIGLNLPISEISAE
jgi:hypothetical protein